MAKMVHILKNGRKTVNPLEKKIESVEVFQEKLLKGLADKMIAKLKKLRK